MAELHLPNRKVHLAIGMFDGLHLGHRRVIQNAIQNARTDGGITAVLTFWPHPSQLFAPENPVPQILTPESKESILRSIGVDLIIEEPFNRKFAEIAAGDFIKHLLHHIPDIGSICIGENWHFGKGRSGNAALLKQLGADNGIAVIAEPRLEYAGSPISSTRIREALREGNLPLANQLLGYPYFTIGTVTEGKKLGRTLGFPTLNIPWPDSLLQPKPGVYAVKVRHPETGSPSLPAVANFGFRPTVETSAPAPLLEIFILGDNCPFTTGDHLQIEWKWFLRPEKRFSDLDQLKTQIDRDVGEAQRFFAKGDRH